MSTSDDSPTSDRSSASDSSSSTSDSHSSTLNRSLTPDPPPKHLSDPKVVRLKTALEECNPFYTGICTIPYYQRLLYYTHDDLVNCIDFSDAKSDQLHALYHACQPAKFGRGNENVFDESYRKARKMDLTSFSTLFDPNRLGIHEQVFRSLRATESNDDTMMKMELYKLNVYGKGDFFKPHKDTPRSQNMFGSLVVVFPTPHEGGQLVLRQGKKEWIIDFTENFTSAQEPSVCFVAFYSDVEHEVLPVTSGYRVTLTYNLYDDFFHPTPPPTPLTPYQLTIKEALVDLVNDKSVLPNGGYLGFDLEEEYAHRSHNMVEPILARLKGPDRALAEICEVLGLNYSLRLLYRNFGEIQVNLIATAELKMELIDFYKEPTIRRYLKNALKGLTIEQAEIVSLSGEEKPDEDDVEWVESKLSQFCRKPFTEVMEIRTKSYCPVYISSPTFTFGDEAETKYAEGTMCMLIRLDPAESRHLMECEDGP